MENKLYDEALSKLAMMEQNSTVLNLQGFCHLEQKRYALARSYFFMAFEKGALAMLENEDIDYTERTSPGRVLFQSIPPEEGKEVIER